MSQDTRKLSRRPRLLLLVAVSISACTTSGENWSEQAFVKASNAEIDDFFNVVSLSGDGNTLAVGAVLESGAGPGLNGNERDNSLPGSGAVYVFTRFNDSWSQQAYLKASNPGADDAFGVAVALSKDGNTLAVGAPKEASALLNGASDPLDDSAPDTGAVYVFTRQGDTWVEEAFLKASNADRGDGFGEILSLSNDGDTLAVSAALEDSAASGVDGDQLDNSAESAGAVHIFSRSDTGWEQTAYLKASNAGSGDEFGRALELSGHGNTLAVGARGENSAAIGIGGSQSDEAAANSGAVYVFTRSDEVWSQQAYIKANNTSPSDLFGANLSLSEFGNTLAVAATLEDSAARGIDGDAFDDTMADSGAVFIYTRARESWTLQAYVKASNTDGGDVFGSAVKLSQDGKTLAVGAQHESSSSSGLDGDETNNFAPHSGAAYLYERTDAWHQSAFVKASNPDADDLFGNTLSMSADGTLIAVGALQEATSSTGVNPLPNNAAPFSGAAYLFEKR